MPNASRDQNNVPTLLGVLNTNGATLIPVQVDSTTNRLKTGDGTTGTNHGPSISPRDQNFVPALMAVSSSDGVTPVVIYADSSGNLLTDSS